MSKEDINNVIIKSNRNLTTALLRMVELRKTKKIKFKLPDDIYTGVYDKKMYPPKLPIARCVRLLNIGHTLAKIACFKLVLYCMEK